MATDLERVLDAIDKANRDSQLLDGRNYDASVWEETIECAERMGRELATLRGFYESTCADLLEHDKADETVQKTIGRIRETANEAHEIIGAVADKEDTK